MRLNINEIKKMKKLRLFRDGIIIVTMIPCVFTGCSNNNSEDYYLVHNNGKYYICTKSKYTNSCDVEYKSINDNKIVGVICLDGNNFDYQCHHLTTDFLSEFQIVNMKEILRNNQISYNKLSNLSQNDIDKLGNEYYQNMKYSVVNSFKYYDNSNLAVFDADNNTIVIGYDISPRRLHDSNDYVYSIIDKDVLDLSNYDVQSYDISEYFTNDNYITYNTTLELSNSKKLKKVLKNRR